MEDSRIIGKIVTKFFLDTCRLHPCTDDKVWASMYCAEIAMEHQSVDDEEAGFIPLTTGSTAEFYIQPMLSCIEDSDFMLHHSDELAIPAGCPPPTQLPTEFDSRVKVYEIVDSEFPGYVYLVSSYLLKECIDDDKYHAVQCQRQYLCSNMGLLAADSHIMHGPATLIPVSRFSTTMLTARLAGSIHSIDLTYCMRCLSWPPQADGWPVRLRNYGWPDSATVDHVVGNGCDMVHVAHRLCRHDERMAEHQWRLSFSRAEIVLLSSWIPVQQIIYHMLRVFVKTERLNDNPYNFDAARVSSYHMKTLMLWACELKPRSWWIDDLNVVRLSVELLHTLCVWLTDACCPYYFIHNCNLFDEFDHIDNYFCEIASRLMSVTEASLAEWFIYSYVRKCARLSYVSRLFEDISTGTELQNAVSAIVDWRIHTSLLQSLANFRSITTLVSFKSVNVRSCSCLLAVLAKHHKGLHVYFTAFIFLKAAAHNTMQGSLKDDMMDVLLTTLLWPQFIPARCCLSSRHSSLLSMSLAAKLMKVVASNSNSIVQLIKIELAKAYLCRALRCKDYNSDSIYCLANVYLAVLYYTTGHYQTAVDHCNLVTRSQDRLQCSSHAVQGELLPKIDNTVDNILGLVVFYQYIRSAVFGAEQQEQHGSIFTTQLFARYWHVRCLSSNTTDMALKDAVRRYQSYVYKMPEMFTADVLVFRLSIQEMTFSGETTSLMPRQLDTPELVELLQQSAVERLTAFRHLEALDFGSIFPIVTTDFEQGFI